MSDRPATHLRLSELEGEYSILRFDPQAEIPTEALQPTAAFVSVSRTDRELSIIAPTNLVESGSEPAPVERSDNWRCLRVEAVTHPSETPGILASIVKPLAEAGVSTFAVASFETDHVLVQDIETARSALAGAGHEVAVSDPSPGEGGQEPSGDDGVAPAGIWFRNPTEADCASLSLLADAATRRLVSWLWDDSTGPGQSSFEVGRQVIRSDTTSLTHRLRWRVAISDGSLVGGLNSYQLPPAVVGTPGAGPNDVLYPLNELKGIAERTWYVSVASVFPESRGLGVGQALLAEAERLARAAEVTRLTLLVGSFNGGAHRLYQRLGYREWERREFVPFPGSDEAGDWILMARDLT